MLTNEQLAEIEAGLKGVTPGPWDFDTELQADTSPRYNEFALFSKEGTYYRQSVTHSGRYFTSGDSRFDLIEVVE